VALLDDVKLALRITNVAYNSEVSDLIDAAEADMSLVGVLNSGVDTDPLIKRAISLYCKAHFGYQNADADKFLAAYTSLRDHLSLSGDYARYTLTFIVTDTLDDPIQGAAVTVMHGNMEYKKLTNSLGVAYFYARKSDNYTYSVEADGFESDLHTHDDKNITDVHADTYIDITLEAVV